MKDELIQRRIYVDTFKGGEFRYEMTENLCEVGPYNNMDMRDWDLTARLDQSVLAEKMMMWQPIL